jgi:hypothetical protein
MSFKLRYFRNFRLRWLYTLMIKLCEIKCLFSISVKMFSRKRAY